MLLLLRALAFIVVVLAPSLAEAQANRPLEPGELAGAWTLTLHPKPGVELQVTDASGRPLKELAMTTRVEVRDGRVVRCLAKLRGESDPPKPVVCGLRKGAFVVEIHGSGNGQKGRLVVRLTRKPSGAITGDATARAPIVPLGFKIGTATLTRAAA